MSDDHERDEESEGKDTEVLPAVDAPPRDLEGTLEMESGALFRRLRSEQKQVDGQDGDLEDSEPAREMSDTQQLPAIDEATTPTNVPDRVVHEHHTQHYEVPDALIERLRDDTGESTTRSISYDRTTRPFTGEELYEFVAVIDEGGRITVPDAIFVAEKVKRGATVKVVMRLLHDDE